MTVAEQARVFLAMALCGAACGALYDALAALRFVLHAGPVLTGLLDLIYGPVCALGMIAVGLALQAEAFRLFAFAAVALGMTLYACTIGTSVRIVCRCVQRVVEKS